MKSIVFVIGILGAGLVGAVGGRLLFPVETGGEAVEIPEESLSRIDELETRMDRLTEELRSVRAERLAPAPDPDTVFPEVEAPEPEDALPSTEPTAAASSDPIEEKVVEIIEAREREQWRKKAQWAEAAQRKKELQWLGRLKEPLALTDDQIENLLRLLAERRQAVAAYKREWAEKGDGITEAEQASLKAGMADYGRRLDGELRSLLSTTQYEGVMKSARAGGK